MSSRNVLSILEYMLVMIVKHSYVFLKPFCFICTRQRSGASVREIVNVSVDSVYVCQDHNHCTAP